jgi:hypothetical protein
MKRLIIYIVISTAILFTFSSLMRYDSSDGITDNRGWPIGYYQLQTQNEANASNALCTGVDILLPVGACNIGPHAVIVDWHLAVNFLIWLTAGAVVGSALYFQTSKPRNT